jgi:nucleotide-binding universal stress UspA family protein
MYINRGPLIFPTTAIDRSVAVLPNVAAFAAARQRPLVIVHLLGKRYEDYSKRRMAELLGKLPPEHAPSEVIVASPHQRMPQLREIAREHGGVIATLPMRRGFLGRLMSLITDYEQLIFEGPLPVLALPPDGALPTCYRKVLFPIDLAPRSNAALDEVVTFCKNVGAELHLLHVFGDDRLLASEVNQAERAAAKSPGELFKLDKRHMEELADRVRAAGVPVTLQSAEGRAHSAILGYVKPHGIELIAMTSHGPRNSEDIWYGTTTARVIRKASVPVFALRA